MHESVELSLQHCILMGWIKARERGLKASPVFLESETVFRWQDIGESSLADL